MHLVVPDIDVNIASSTPVRFDNSVDLDLVWISPRLQELLKLILSVAVAGSAAESD
jgi:hypothetical protein